MACVFSERDPEARGERDLAQELGLSEVAREVEDVGVRLKITWRRPVEEQ